MMGPLADEPSTVPLLAEIIAKSHATKRLCRAGRGPTW